MSATSEDNFASSASYYTEFRKPYPELLCQRLQIDQTGLFDWSPGASYIFAKK